MLQSETPDCNDDPKLDDPLEFVWPTEASCNTDEDPLTAVDDPIETPATTDPAEEVESPLENATTGKGILIETEDGTAIWFPTTDLENVLGTPKNGLVLLTKGVPSIVVPEEGKTLIAENGVWSQVVIPRRIPKSQSLGTFEDAGTTQVALTDSEASWTAATLIGVFQGDSSDPVTFTIGETGDQATFTLLANESLMLEFTVGLKVGSESATLPVTVGANTDAALQLNLQAIWK